MTFFRTNRILAVIIAATLTADWATKFWVVNRLAIGETISLVDGWLYFVHRQNPGVAFSMLADLPETIRVPLLTALSLAGVVLFSRMLVSTPDRWARLAAAAVIAGAVGNMGERMFFGGVTDFVVLAFFPFVFNIADTAITLGGSVLAVRMFRGEEMLGAAEPAGSV